VGADERLPKSKEEKWRASGKNGETEYDTPPLESILKVRLCHVMCNSFIRLQIMREESREAKFFA